VSDGPDAGPVPGLSLVIDCVDPEALASFWAGALGYVVVGAEGNYVALVPDGRPGPNLLLQRVAEEKTTKNRVHLDIKVPDVEGLVERLEGLGARRAEDGVRSELGATWVVMLDPAGNEFCVCDGAGGC
jgi:predicted enzyme related to lactoylglutathione lyase